MKITGGREDMRWRGQAEWRTGGGDNKRWRELDGEMTGGKEI